MPKWNILAKMYNVDEISWTVYSCCSMTFVKFTCLLFCFWLVPKQFFDKRLTAHRYLWFVTKYNNGFTDAFTPIDTLAMLPQKSLE